MRVLGIETSCDETGVALYDEHRGLLAHALYSQVRLHAGFGGVVPELASRDHVRKLLPLVREVLAEAGCAAGGVDGVAYTEGPGLVGALLVGAAFARGFAFSRGVPCVGVHHMEGHLLAPMLEPGPPAFPFLALLVSGGHTMLVDVTGVGRYRVLGQTLDDAAGEAFDKTAKLLGLAYPGGPALAKLAGQGRAGRFDFPRPMLRRPGLDFSFSGLKTAVLHAVRDHPDDPATRADIARGFEDAVVDVLAGKCRRALRELGPRPLVVAGGVGANARLRQRLEGLAREAGVGLHYPRPEFCTDNGSMIAYAGLLRLPDAAAGSPDVVKARPRWPLDSLRPPGSVGAAAVAGA